ncbi:MAG: peptidoglycan binding protein CsiV [Hydrogenovibrio sp.]
MIRRLFFSLITASFLSLGVTLNAQAEGLPKYQVELIVFESLALRGWTEEYWPEIPPIWIDNAVSLTPLPSSQRMLNSEARKMTTQRGYRILYHEGWVLYGKPENQSRLIRIESLPEKSYESKLLGSLLFYKSRFAHVQLDLELERIIPKRIRQAFAENEHLTEAELPAFWRFELRESRKVKSGELHYFDHPLFGAILKIQYLGQ